jgi:hypothetical protein
MFSLSMLEHVQSIHKHTMYSMISMMTAMLLHHLATDVTSILNWQLRMLTKQLAAV